MIYKKTFSLLHMAIAKESYRAHIDGPDTDTIEVVPVEALSVEREGRERAEQERDDYRKLWLNERDLRSVALGVAADLRKWAERDDAWLPGALKMSDHVIVHRAKLLSRAARLEGKEDG